jgi:hypothetical protein
VVPWPESKEVAKQMKKLGLLVSETESTIKSTKPLIHNFGLNPLRGALAKSGAILVNSA